MGPVVLLGLSAATSLLALLQWMELLVSRAGGTTFCAVNETISCQRVWDSAFAQRIHTWTGVPVAGWGLVWALTCFGLALLWTARRLKAQDEAVAAAALKWTAMAGVFTTLTLAAASMRAGALCLTCLATYVLVLAIAAAASRWLPEPLFPRGVAARDGLLWSGLFALGGFLLVLYPGLRTPHALEAGWQPPAQKSGVTPTPSLLAAFVSKVSPTERQFLSDALEEYRRAPAPAVHHPVRFRVGVPNAPVQVVEFTDVLCPHCRHFAASLAQVKQSLPPDTLSLEPRQYPLDGVCNPTLPLHEGGERLTGKVRCLAAQALICLESTPDFAAISERLFENQDTLTPDSVMEIATSGAMKRPAMQACLESPDTRNKLLDDLQYAQEFRIQGTPLVVVNGKRAAAAPLFIYALALAGGDVEAFSGLGLPPPRPQTAP